MFLAKKWLKAWHSCGQILNTAISSQHNNIQTSISKQQSQKKDERAKYERVKSVLMEWFWQNGLSLTT
jgi:hypothetical protein